MFKLSDVEIAADQRWQDYVHPVISSRYKGMCGVFRKDDNRNIDRYKHVQSFLDNMKNQCIVYLRFELKTKVLDCI